MKNYENVDFECLINSEGSEAILQQPGAKQLVLCFLGIIRKPFFARLIARVIARLIAQLRI